MQHADDLSIINSLIFLNKYGMVPWLCVYFILPAAQGAGADKGNHGFVILLLVIVSQGRGQDPVLQHAAADVLF